MKIIKILIGIPLFLLSISIMGKELTGEIFAKTYKKIEEKKHENQ